MVSILLIWAWLLFPFWLPVIGKFLVVADPLKKVDALVILAGDEDERISTGTLLFKQGFAEWFILTDMHLYDPNSEGMYSAQIKRKVIEQGIPATRILIVPGQVSTTAEEASHLKAFSVTKGFHSLIVVTSPYHTRRARWLLREAFRDSGVNLIIRPVVSGNYQASDWWRKSLDRKLTALEYGKILAHILGCREYGDCGPIPWYLLKRWQKNITHPN